MNAHLEALRNCIISETIAAYPDFHFAMFDNPEGNLTVDCREKRESDDVPNLDDIPFLTIEHDGKCFIASHYRWNDRKKYKTLKGISKYVNNELQDSCSRKRNTKAEQDAKRIFKEDSVELLQNFHNLLSHKGIESRLFHFEDHGRADYLSLEAKRLDVRICITVAQDYRLELAFSYPQITTEPETVLDILAVLLKEKSA